MATVSAYTWLDRAFRMLGTTSHGIIRSTPPYECEQELLQAPVSLLRQHDDFRVEADNVVHRDVGHQGQVVQQYRVRQSSALAFLDQGNGIRCPLRLQTTLRKQHASVFQQKTATRKDDRYSGARPRNDHARCALSECTGYPSTLSRHTSAIGPRSACPYHSLSECVMSP